MPGLLSKSCDIMIWVKKHGEVLAACDESILDEIFEEGELCMQVKKSFYAEELVDESGFRELLRESDNINIIGKEAVRIAVEEGLVKATKSIEAVPYAIIIKI